VKDYKERLEAREGKIFDLESQLRRLREMSNLKDLEMEKTKKSIEDLRHAQKLGSDSSSLINLSKELDALKS
jgi:bacterioferritin (cytochrome b1)